MLLERKRALWQGLRSSFKLLWYLLLFLAAAVFFELQQTDFRYFRM